MAEERLNCQVHQIRKNDSAKKKGSCCGTKYFFGIALGIYKTEIGSFIP